MFDAEIKLLRENPPLVHCITNPVTINDCANLLLSCGASPIMADDPMETAEVVSSASALVLNLGMPNPRKLEGMLTAGKEANRRKIPVVLDPVGVGVSRFRTESVQRLLKEIEFSVIRGNISEIHALCGIASSSRGVDALADMTQEQVNDAVHHLANATGAVVAVSAATDVVTDGLRRIHIHGGTPLMSRISGTGCMLTALIGMFCGVLPQDPLKAATIACALMKRFGEHAALMMECRNTGFSSMRRYLIDTASRLDFLALQGGFHIEDW